MTESNPNPLPRVQFLSFEDCPLADAAREVLERALESVGRSARDYSDLDVLDPATPAELAQWGSPTILVNGLDVTGHPLGDAPGCRVYDTPTRVPDLDRVTRALNGESP